MDKITFINNQEPALNETNLNQIQTNVENAINATKPHQINVGEDTDYRVNLLKTKNLFDAVLEQGTFSNVGVKSSSSTNYRSATMVAVKPNTTYTFSINGVSQKYGVYYYNSEGTFINAEGLTTGTFTTPANTKYINMRCFNADYVSNYATLKIQLEEGSTATEYTPFINNQINIDNEKYSDTINVGVEEDNRSRVNVLKSKNLIDVDINDVQSGLWFSTDETSITQNTNGFYVVMPITAGSYTISRKNNNSITGLYFAAFTTASNPANGVSIVDKGLQNGATIKKINITATSTAKYLIIYIIASVPSAVDNAKKTSAIEELQVEKGNEQTAYEPYIVPSIKVDNEEIYKKPVILWENPSITSDFSNQTITLNDSLENYDYYEVIFLMSKYEQLALSSGLIPSSMSTSITTIRLAGGTGIIARYRDILRNSATTLMITKVSKISGSSTTITEEVDRVIPYRIIGH